MNPAYVTARDCVVSMLSNFPEGSLTLETIRKRVAETVAFLRDQQPDIEFPASLEERLVKELEAAFNVWIGTSKILEDDTGHERWLEDRRDAISWDFWSRYRRYLLQNWASPAPVQSVESLTDEILSRLEDPQRPGEWDRRGLVVGHVQSGKTANYTGLICKAADAGYRLIVVLAGMYNDLRSQTQVRLEEGFLGYASLAGEARQPVGVGLLDHSLRAHTITDRTDAGDFNRRVANQFNIAPGQEPLLFVVKKNASTLRNLLNWVNGFANATEAASGRRYVDGVPLLVIDDEADQASVNPNPDFKTPARINSLIRQLLYGFAQSAYVGYTATPFANIFISEGARTDSEGQDLFPRSFIIALPTPSNYVGPLRVFGLEEDPETGMAKSDPLPLVRTANDGWGWMPARHKKDLRPHYSVEQDLPPSLHEAMLSFLVAGAAREARGMTKAHHTMLVHVTRFVDVQGLVGQQVAEHLASIRQRLIYGDGLRASILAEMQALWLTDFAPTMTETARLMGPGDEELLPLEWPDVERHLRRVVEATQVRVLNGTSEDALEYEANRATGLKVIAVGGNRLSRGLTLEGLTTSYFLRSTRMYDTLMQMGRWFGYRPGYVDLCRLYLPDDLREWFQHITTANEELRREFEYMRLTGATPKTYGLRVRSHPALLVTAQVRMRAAVPLSLSFAGETSETVVFPKAPDALERNLDACRELVGSLGVPTGAPDPRRGGGNFVWQHVAATDIVGFLKEYRSHPEAWRVNCDLLREFIERQVEAGELTSWTVCLVSSQATDARQIQVSDLRVGLTKRRTPGSKGGAGPSGPPQDKLTIRRLLSPSDEAIDLTPEQRERALRQTREERGEASVPSGLAIRSARRPQCGLLLIYLLDPEDVGGSRLADAQTPVVAFGLSFPASKTARSVDYRVTHRYWEQLYGSSDWDDDEDES